MKCLLITVLVIYSVLGFSSNDSIMCYNMNAAIEKSISKFNQLHAKFKRSDVAMMYNLLQLEFSISDSIPSAKMLVDSNSSLQESYFKLYNRYFFNRTKAINRDSQTVHSILYKSLDNIDSRTLWSFYCRVYPMPDDVFNYIASYLEKQGYDYTHAVFHLYNIQENRCKDDSLTSNMLQHAYPSLQKMMHENILSNFELDLKIECIALLSYMKQFHRISQDDWNLILKSQNEDGSWSSSRNSLEPLPGNEHTTILALWALLEGRRNFQKSMK